MVRDVIAEGDPILRRHMPNIQNFDKFVGVILDDLKDTMFATGAVGFAANQINYEANVCIVRMKDDAVLELINPIIMSRRGRIFSPEGCLSIPDYVAIIPRSAEVKIGHRNRAGKPILTTLVPPYSRYAEHEIDHLNGILIRDYVEGKNGKKGGIDAERGYVLVKEAKK